ncbi:MAG TPA: 2Fe-2S iron-sulfur cluster-binding protein, partial [Acidimicrobiales bacterium]|nr:2Fe-2S iron-sulfur cluster-binding protein [Acidimicrobiales bacterium]
LRQELGVRSVKDGCSPQGQCGCCTVWVDGAPRVACVTPVRRVAGRQVTTLEGLDPTARQRWVQAFVDHGASQCGFCTPGIVMRLVALEGHTGPAGLDEAAVGRALAAHLCRCTGWRTIFDAARAATSEAPASESRPRDWIAAAERAELEGASAQCVGPDVVLGRGGFTDDTAPADALVAVPGDHGDWVVAETAVLARSAAGRVPGRNSTRSLRHPLEFPSGDFVLRLRTTFVEPAYLEPDASWCVPGGLPASPLANGGAFGGKRSSPLPAVAIRLADEHGRPVRVLYSREDVARRGPKRPPIAAGVRADGSGVIRVATTPGSADLASWRKAVASVSAAFEVEEVAVAGPPVSPDIRGAGWAEAAVLRAVWEMLPDCEVGAGRPVTVRAGDGATATVTLADGAVSVEVAAGAVLDEVVLRSYVVGAVHQGLSWVRSEGLAVDDDGEVLNLTVRSFGVLPARHMPEVRVVVEHQDGPPRRVGDAVLAAAAAAAWLAGGLSPDWPLERGGS